MCPTISFYLEETLNGVIQDLASSDVKASIIKYASMRPMRKCPWSGEQTLLPRELAFMRGQIRIIFHFHFHFVFPSSLCLIRNTPEHFMYWLLFTLVTFRELCTSYISAETFPTNWPCLLPCIHHGMLTVSGFRYPIPLISLVLCFCFSYTRDCTERDWLWVCSSCH